MTTTSARELLRQQHRNGTTPEQLAQDYGISIGTVNLLLSDATSRASLPDMDRDLKVIQLYADHDNPIPYILAEAGISGPTMYNILRRNRIPLRGHVGVANDPHAVTAISVAYGSGMSVPEIAKQLGITKTTVYAALRKAGIEVRKDARERRPGRPLLTALDDSQLRTRLAELYVDTEMTVAAIAVELNISTSTLYRMVREMDLPGRQYKEGAVQGTEC